MPGNLTLFQTKEAQFCYPVPDKNGGNVDTLFKTKKCEMRLTFESKTVCLSKRAAGPEWEQQHLFTMGFWQ